MVSILNRATPLQRKSLFSFGCSFSERRRYHPPWFNAGDFNPEHFWVPGGAVR